MPPGEWSRLPASNSRNISTERDTGSLSPYPSLGSEGATAEELDRYGAYDLNNTSGHDSDSSSSNSDDESVSPESSELGFEDLAEGGRGSGEKGGGNGRWNEHGESKSFILLIFLLRPPTCSSQLCLFTFLLFKVIHF
ncbi:hypothetical protein T492DRAFT_440989 [Pavlovales sp. CCMP2436]|nr:hypothetical protein T492DRAFT_440989 [Pavlovales sp. CCMP2436]